MQKIREDGKILLCSDLHICDSVEGRDNFTGTERFINLIKEKDPNLIVICGDFFELWQAKYKIIMKTYRYLIDFLKTRNVVCLWGNHDFSIQKHESFPFPVFEKIIIEHKDKQYVCLHGHQFDFFSKYKRFRNVVKLFVWIWGWIEQIIFKNDTTKSRNLKSYVSPASKNYKGNRDEYLSGAKNILDELNVDGVFMGHTHKIEKCVWVLKDKDAFYQNLGCWVNGSNDYIILENKG